MPTAEQLAALADYRTARADRDRAQDAVLRALVMESDGDRVTAENARADATVRMALGRERALARDAGFDLLSGPHPLLLLPVRLEARFAWTVGPRTVFTQTAGAPRVLLVRIIPDEIHQDPFQRALTPAERRWLDELRVALALSRDYRDLVKAWSELIRRVGPYRAGWFGELLRRPRDILLRPDRFTQPAVARLLPDRWLAFAELDDGSTLTAMSSQPVREPLEVGADPVSTGWMTNFSAALKAGMGLIVTDIPDAVTQVRRLTVVGARGTLDPAEAAAELSGALEAHHYTRGLRLLRPGTATNSAPGTRAGYTSRPDLESVLGVETRRVDASGLAHPLCQPGVPGAGNDLATALGIDADVLGYVAGADATDQDGARDLRELLIAASWRPIVRLSHQILAPEDLETFRVAIGTLSAIGPLPALGVGPQPYGVLPVLMRQPGQPAAGTIAAAVLTVLDRMRPLWEQAVATDVPWVGKPGADPGQTVIRILQQDAVVRQVAFRPVLGPQLAAVAAQGLDPAAGDRLARARAAAAAAIDALGAAGSAASPLVAVMHEPFAAPLTAPLVEPPGLPAASPLRMGRYLEQAASWPLDLLLRHDYGGAPRPRALLFAVARLAMLNAADDAARAMLITSGADPARWDDENVPSIFTDPYGTPLSRLEAPDPRRSGQTIANLLSERGAAGAALDPVRALVRGIGSRAAEEVEELLRATLGLFGHRLDAWYTGLAADRLTEMRNTQPTTDGVNVGGYGVLENIGLSPRQLAPGTTDLFTNPVNGGFVHAPSVNQGATAAILRSVHLAHAAAGHGEAFSVDLSSDRVRAGVEVLDGIRAGQPLPALIGYRIERALAAEGLQRFIAPLRDVAPLPANRLTPAALPAESVAATNVVDGLDLLAKAGYDGGTPPTVARLWQNAPALGPYPAAKDEVALGRVLRAGYDAIDGVADLAVAESVFQTVQGNPARAGATVDGLAGAPVPAPHIGVVETPRSGVGVTHRLLVLLEAADQMAAAGWGWTPRAKADPRIEAWARAMLPDPAQIAVRARFRDGDGVEVGALDLTLADLNAAPAGIADHLRVGARDLVQAADPAAPDSALTLRLAALADQRRPAGAADAALELITERLATWPAATFSLPEVAEITRQVRLVLSHARPVQPADLAPPAQVPPAAPDTAELAARATTAVTELGSVRAALVTADAAAGPVSLRQGLFRADALGVAGAAPATLFPAGDPGAGALALANLQEQARAAVTELDQRASAVSQLAGDDQAGRLAAVFGPGFTVLPVLGPMASLTALLGPPGLPEGATPSAASAWLDRAAQVREPAAALDRLLGYAETVGLTDAARPAPRAHVGQLAGAPGERWVALPPVAGTAVPGGRVSLVALTPGPDLPDFGGTGVAGLLVDEWVEVVPAAEETTSVSFHLDAPSSAPPQVLLLGVPPAGHELWTPQEARHVVDEALALGRIRLVDLGQVPGLGQLLPAFFSAENTGSEAAGLDVEALTEPES